MKAVLRLLDRGNEAVGVLASWSALLMVLVTCFIVVSRYLFNTGSIAIQETVIYLNAILFMLSSAYTLKHDGHVRVDIFYSRAGRRYQSYTNLFGTLCLLLPVCIFIIWSSWDYVQAAWSIREKSGESGGLPLVYLLKSLIIIMAVLLISQGSAEVIRNILSLRGENSSAGAPEEHTGL